MSRQIYDGKIHIFYFCVTRALYKCFVRCKKLRENFYRSYNTCLYSTEVFNAMKR